MQNRRGQSTAEYAIVISVVIAAVVGMQLYVKRGMQGKVKDATDHFTEQVGKVDTDPNLGKGLSNASQYEPYYTADGQTSTTQDVGDTEVMASGGTLTKTASHQNSTRTGSTTQGTDWNNATREGIWTGR